MVTAGRPNWWQSSRVLTGAFVLGFVVLGTIGVLAYRTTSNLIEIEQSRDHYRAVREQVQLLLTELDDAETGQRGFLITGKEPYLQPYDQATGAIHKTTEELDREIHLPSEHRKMNQLKPLIARKLSEMQETINLRRSSGFAASREIVLTDRGKRRMDEIRKAVAAMTAEEDTLLTAGRRAAHASADRARRVLLSGGILSVFLLMLVFFVLTREIAARKRIEVALRQANDDLAGRRAELEAANKELEAFTYSVSHDLRAPLRHVDGFSKLLIEESTGGLSEDAKRYLAFVREGVLQMGQLVDDLLNLARVGRKELSMQVTGLKSLANDAVADLKRDNPSRAIEWRIQQLPFVECDAALMKQVFMNLLANAVKYSRPRERAVIEVGAKQENGLPVIFVRDNGVGFDMKYADKLFGVFQRLHRAEDFEGTGVGLATVQRIIHKHGGQVWADAALDHGATFFFTVGKAAHAALEKRVT